MTLTERIENISPDAAIYKAWNLTGFQWAAMSDAERVWHRSNVAKAMQS